VTGLILGLVDVRVVAMPGVLGQSDHSIVVIVPGIPGTITIYVPAAVPASLNADG
jgi:hypothetical protein